MQQESLADPDTSNVQGARRGRLEATPWSGRSHNELGRSSADISDEHRTVVGSSCGQSRGGTGKREPALFFARENLWNDAEDVCHARQELFGVGGVPSGRCGRDAQPSHKIAIHSSSVTTEDIECPVDRLTGQLLRRVDSFTQPRDVHLSVECDSIGSHNEQPRGIGAAVNGGHRATAQAGPLQTNLGRRPTPDRIVSPSQMPGQVGMETLDPPPGATDSPRGSRPGMPRGDHLFSGFRVPRVCGLYLFVGELRDGTAYATLRLEAAHGDAKVGINEPIAGRHGSAIFEERRVLDDDGRAIRSPHDHGERACRWAAQQIRHALPVRCRRGFLVVPGQGPRLERHQ